MSIAINIRFWRKLLIVVVAIWGALGLHAKGLTEISLDILQYRPSIIGSSVNGKYYLLSVEKATGSELRIMEVGSQKLYKSINVPFIPMRITWSTDSGSIAFFANSGSGADRHLFIWDIQFSVPREIEIPQTIAEPVVKFSPSGQFLAYISGKETLMIVPAKGTGTAIQAQDRVHAFDWNQDMIVAVQSNGHQILTIDPNKGKTIQRYSDVHNLLFEEIASFSPDSCLALSLEEVNRNVLRRISVYKFPLGEGSTELFKTTSNIYDIRSLHGGGILWHEQKADGNSFIVTKLSNRVERNLTGSGEGHIRTILDDPAHVDGIVYTPYSHKLVRFNLETGGEDMVAEQIGVRCKDLKVTLQPYGSVLQVALPEKEPLGVVIRMNGGTAITLAGERWMEMQLFLKRGYAFIHVPNVRDHGPDVLLEAVKYCNKVLGIDSKKIAVIAASSAATATITAILRDPDAVQSVSLMGVIPQATLSDLLVPSKRPQLLIYHGGQDPHATELEVKRYIFSVFGPLKKDRDVFRLYPNEGHFFVSLDAVAEYYSDVLSSLER